jgi:hypothetical protein
VLSIGLVFSTAAWADHYVYVGRDYAVVASQLHNFAACDVEQDGNGVYGIFTLENGQELRVNDPNGSANGCGIGENRQFKVTRFRVCKNLSHRPDPCSEWKYTPEAGAPRRCEPKVW